MWCFWSEIHKRRDMLTLMKYRIAEVNFEITTAKVLSDFCCLEIHLNLNVLVYEFCVVSIVLHIC